MQRGREAHPQIRGGDAGVQGAVESALDTAWLRGHGKQDGARCCPADARRLALCTLRTGPGRPARRHLWAPRVSDATLRPGPCWHLSPLPAAPPPPQSSCPMVQLRLLVCGEGWEGLGFSKESELWVLVSSLKKKKNKPTLQPCPHTPVSGVQAKSSFRANSLPFLSFFLRLPRWR